jgi:hypothetical protein
MTKAAKQTVHFFKNTGVTALKEPVAYAAELLAYHEAGKFGK